MLTICCFIAPLPELFGLFFFSALLSFMGIPSTSSLVGGNVVFWHSDSGLLMGLLLGSNFFGVFCGNAIFVAFATSLLHP